MRRLLALAIAAAATAAAEAPPVESVYFLPMSHSLDLYLANRLTAEKVYSVTTDPKRANAVFTDRLGEGFETKMAELFPPPDAVKADGDEKVKAEERPRHGFAAGARGTIFLVDARTRQVIWSAFERPKNSRPEELNRTAGHLVERLKRDLQPVKGK